MTTIEHYFNGQKEIAGTVWFNETSIVVQNTVMCFIIRYSNAEVPKLGQKISKKVRQLLNWGILSVFWTKQVQTEGFLVSKRCRKFLKAILRLRTPALMVLSTFPFLLPPSLPPISSHQTQLLLSISNVFFTSGKKKKLFSSSEVIKFERRPF